MSNFPTFLPKQQKIDDDLDQFNRHVASYKPLDLDYNLESFDKHVASYQPLEDVIKPQKQAPQQKRDLLSEIGDIARELGHDDDAAKVAQAIARTEGALEGAVGDRDLPGGGSYGPFQFYKKYGMMPAYAKSLGMDEDQAGEYARANPQHAARWALQGYLGQAIKEGQAKGLRGSDLATYAQTHGQRSQSPERAGANYSAMFGGGTPQGAQQAPLRTLQRPTAEAQPERDPLKEFGDYTGKLMSDFNKSIGDVLQVPGQLWEQNERAKEERLADIRRNARQSYAPDQKEITTQPQGQDDWMMQQTTQAAKGAMDFNESLRRDLPGYAGAADVLGGAYEVSQKGIPAMAMYTENLLNPASPYHEAAVQNWNTPHKSAKTLGAIGKAAQEGGFNKVMGIGQTPYEQELWKRANWTQLIPEGAPRGAAGLAGELTNKAVDVRMPDGIQTKLTPEQIDALRVAQETGRLPGPTLGEHWERWQHEKENPLVEGLNPVNVLLPDPGIETARLVFGAGKQAVKAAVPPLKRAGQVFMEGAKDVPVGLTVKDVSKVPLATEPAPTFYSQLERTLADAKQPKWKPGDLRGYLRAAGVKDEELKWTGFDDYLQERASAGQSVTREEALQFVKDNQVEVKEVVKGAVRGPNKQSPYAIPEVLRIGQDYQGNATDALALTLENDANAYRALMRRFPELREDEDWARTVANDVFGTTQNATDAKFSQYQTPGGENYRELLLTLPVKGNVNESRLQQLYRDAVTRNLTEAELGEIAALERGAPAGSFISPHFSEPNVLAHVRFNDRVDASGKKVLFVEEVQSDWHQAGRSKGYRASERLDQPLAATDMGGYWEVRTADGRFVTNAMRHDGFDTAEAAVNEGRRRLQGNNLTVLGRDDTVPVAPFSKTWPELAMKRVIRWAADNGYDRVAWTTGKQQAERYDLSKQVRRINLVNPVWKEDGTLSRAWLDASTPSGQQVINKEVTGAELPDIIGKEATEKLLYQPSRKEGFAASGQGVHILEGDDLKVGGQGMIGFYDRMLPETMNKLGKKFGARVGETNLDGKSALRFIVLDDEKYRIHGEFATRREAEDAARQMGDGYFVDEDTVNQIGPTVHSIDITPSMKESVLKGQPLFMAPEATGAVLGGVYGLATDDPNLSDRERTSEFLQKVAGGGLGARVLTKGMKGIKPGLTVQPVSSNAANQTLLDMYAPKPGRGLRDVLGEGHSIWETGRRAVVRAATDRDVDLAQYQKAMAKAKGAPLTPDELLYELHRLNPDKAAEVKIGEALRQPLQDAGDDLPWVSVYLTHQDNIDVAKAMGQKVAKAKGTAAGAKAEAERKFSGGLNVEASRQALADMAVDLGPERMAQVESTAKAAQELGRALLQRKLDAGLITKELFDELTTAYPNYVPTRITDYMKEPLNIPVGKSLSVRDAGLRRNTIEGTVREREDPIASMIRNAYETETLARKNEAFNAFVKLREYDPEMQKLLREVPDSYTTKRGEAKVTGFVSGVRQTYVVPSALEQIIKSEPGAALPGFAGAVWGGLINLFRMGATTRNPVFLASNAFLDAATYTVRATAREGGPQHLPKVLAELGKAYADAFAGITTRQYKGKTAEFLREGGGMFGFFQGSPGETRATVNALTRKNILDVKNPGDLLRIIRDLVTLKPVEGIGERIELAPRVAQYNLASRRASTVKAVIEGRTVTIDFAQGGNVAKVINQFVPFFNVGMQATAQPFRAIAENPKGFAATAGALLAGPVIAAEAWNRGDPQRAKDYDDVPRYLKDQGVVVMLPTEAAKDEKGNRKPQFVHIRLREFAPFAILTREAAQRALGDDPREWQDLLASTMGAISPVQGNNPTDMLSSFTPLGVSTGLQLGVNKDIFRDRMIATKYGDENASEISKAVAGATGVRPSQAEFAIRDLGTGVAGSVLAAGDLIAGKRKNTGTVQDVPVLGGAAGRFVKGNTGGRLDEAQSKLLTPEGKQILKDSGTDINIGTVSNTIEAVPLLMEEQTRYQELTNKYVDEHLKIVTQEPKWASYNIDEREYTLRWAIDKARDRAAADVLRALGNEEIRRRLAKTKGKP